MRPILFGSSLVFGLLLFVVGVPAQEKAVDRIMFGSCLDETRAHPALEVALDREPDAFLFLGDNVYADSSNPQLIRRSYARLAESGLFRALRNDTRVYATWDDHDYGRNDAGRGFSARSASEEIFEAFWDIDGPARERPGIYHAVELGAAGRRVQIILLDTRYFRSPLTRARPRPSGKGPYAAQQGSGTLLGEAQWQWLEVVLDEPAELRLVASSIQVLASHHGWESWANFPHEQERLFSLLSEADGQTVIVSGDRHFAEISRRKFDGDGTSLVDVTSSGINRRYPAETPTANDYRVDGYYLDHNVGELELFWGRAEEPPRVRIRIYDVEGTVRIEHEVR